MKKSGTKDIIKLLNIDQRVIFNSIINENLYLKKLLEVSRKISRLDFISSLQFILNTIISITKAKRGYIILIDPDHKLDFENIICKEEDCHFSEKPDISISIAEDIIKSENGKLIDSLGDEPEYKTHESVIKLKLKAVMCVPLFIKSIISGVIYVDSDSYNHNFSEKGFKIFEAFASFASIIIENTKLFEKIKKENVALKEKVKNIKMFEDIVYQSKIMDDITKNLNHVLDNSITILIQGETGTGKELIAKAIHSNSIRKEKPFLAINCGAISDTLLESELFGHKRGAFTGAYEDKTGLFESADGGTIFLDEIGTTTKLLQIKLLRVLETNTIRCIGENVNRKIDVRIIAATNQDLKKSISNEKFRKDLYYRLNAYPIIIPPLRDRKEDIPCLINHFIEYYNRKLKKNIKSISKESINILVQKDWPGNVRELKNYIYKAMIMATSDKLLIYDNKQAVQIRTSTSEDKLKSLEEIQILSQVEKDYIIKVILLTNGNISLAAKKLGLKRSTLVSKMEKLNIK